MKPSAISKQQALDIVKVAAYLGVSAALDYLISQTSGSEFGQYTVIINLALVTIKKAFTKA